MSINYDLGWRAIACKSWRWMPGMAYLRRGKSHRVDPEVLVSGGSYDDTCLPDLTDPATIGCLLALYDAKRPKVCPDPVYTYAATHGLSHPVTVAALVGALEAAP